MTLRWTRPALQNLADIHAHIAEHDPAAALKIARTIRAQAESLRGHPRMGRAGRVAGTRELVIAGYPYLIAYRVTDTTVDILAVRHGAQRWPDSLD